MSKYQSLSEWLAENYTPLNDWIHFNATTMEAGNASINTMEGQSSVTDFIDGSKEVNLLFAIAMIKNYDTQMSEVNLEAISELDNFMNWLHEQNENKNFPDLGGNTTVYQLSVLDGTPSIAVDSSQNLAKYQFNCSINYLERKADNNA